jgi:agmatine deiminase
MLVCRSLTGAFLAFLACLGLLPNAAAAPDEIGEAAGYEFPPEWAPHDAVWMGWAEPEEHQSVQVEMIAAMSPHVAVRLLVQDDKDRQEAASALELAGVDLDRVSFVEHPLYNVWTRDTGPRFLTDGDGLAIADPGWNAYGYPAELRVGTSRDPLALGRVDDDLASQLELPVVSSRIVAEGGGVEVSSDVLMTYRETAMQRNPGVSLAEIEAEYLRVYGKKKVLWLGHSPLSDRVFSGPKYANYFGWGANGHIDEYVRFVDDRTIVIAQVSEDDAAADPLAAIDRKILLENFRELRESTDASGEPYEIVTLPAPALHHYMWSGPLPEDAKARDVMGAWYRSFEVGDEIHWIPALSYLNFFITNDVVLVPGYWHQGIPETERQKDEEVRQIFARLFPDREVVQIDPLALNWAGGGMHCVTQQQPSLSPGVR